MNYKGYFATLEYEDTSSRAHGRVVMPHVILTFQSDSVEGLKREFAISMEDYFEWCREEGHAPLPALASHNPAPLPEEAWENMMRLDGHAARIRFDDKREVFVGTAGIEGRAHLFEGVSVADLKHALAEIVAANTPASQRETKRKAA